MSQHKFPIIQLLIGIFIGILIILGCVMQWNNNHQNPSVDKIDYNHPNMIVLHRPGCKLCDSAEPEMLKMVYKYNSDENHNNKAYYVNYDSKFGKKIARDYKIEHPATAVLITGKNSEDKYYTHPEVIKDESTGKFIAKPDISGMESMFIQLKKLEKK